MHSSVTRLSIIALCADFLRRSPVTKVSWARAPTPKHPADKLTLASADSSGKIVVWNVKTGEVKTRLEDSDSSSGSNRPVHEMCWLDGRVEGTGHLLAALHPPFSLVLWDTAAGAPVWRKAYAETLQGFDFDPFNPGRVAFRCLECVLFVEDFHHSKAPGSSGKKFYVSGPSPAGRGSPTRTAGGIPSSSSVESLSAAAAGPASSTPATPLAPSASSSSLASTPLAPTAAAMEEKGRAARTKIKRLMRELVMGEQSSSSSPGGGDGSSSSADAFALSECLAVKHHRAVRNHLLLVYPREVLVLDLDIGQTVGLVRKTFPSFLSFFVCLLRPI